MSLNQGLVGVQNNADGSIPITQQFDQQGGALVTELHARYYQQNVRGNMFYGSNGATPSVTTVALATTYTGLALINPANSLVNLVVNKVGYSFLVAFPAAATIGVMAGWSSGGVITSSNAASPGASSKMGNTTTPTGKCVLSATFPVAPFLHTVLGTGLTGAITTTPANTGLVDLEGSLVIAPGGYAAIYTSTVSGAASLCGSFEWEEVPLIR